MCLIVTKGRNKTRCTVEWYIPLTNPPYSRKDTEKLDARFVVVAIVVVFPSHPRDVGKFHYARLLRDRVELFATFLSRDGARFIDSISHDENCAFLKFTHKFSNTCACCEMEIYHSS